MTEKEEKAQWTKTEEEENLWSKKDLLDSALEFVYVTVRDKDIVCRRITKEEEIEIQKKTLDFSTATGTLTDIDIPLYQLEVLTLAMVKPKMNSDELKTLDAALFNEMFVAYQTAIGLVLDSPQNL